MNTLKKCNHCLVNKPFIEFHKWAGAKDGLMPQCRACRKEAAAKHYQENKGRVLARNLAYQAQNPEKNREHAARYRANNPDTVKRTHKTFKALNADRLAPANNARSKAWRIANPGRYRALHSKRRAFKIKATPTWANQTAIADFYLTAQGLSMLTGEWYHVDHIIPLKGRHVCGLHVESNLQVLLGKDNLRKGNR